MKVVLLRHTAESELLCAAAARRCRTDERVDELFENVHVEKTLEHCIRSGHYSVLEHAVFTFHVEGVSRALLAQLTRHRIASFSVQSQRAVNMNDFEYVVPESIKSLWLVDYRYRNAMEVIKDTYNELVKCGIPEEDARYVLPNAAMTKIIFTMNARELLHFFTLRCCNKAQWEIRELANLMLSVCRQEAPLIFEKAGPPCVRGECREVEKCGANNKK